MDKEIIYTAESGKEYIHHHIKNLEKDLLDAGFDLAQRYGMQSPFEAMEKLGEKFIYENLIYAVTLTLANNRVGCHLLVSDDDMLSICNYARDLIYLRAMDSLGYPSEDEANVLFKYAKESFNKRMH